MADEELGDDDVFVLESIAEAKKNEEDRLRVTLVISLKDTMTSLTRILKIIEVKSTKQIGVRNRLVNPIMFQQISNGDIVHIETRETRQGSNNKTDNSESNNSNGIKVDTLLRIDIKHGNLLLFLKSLKRCSSLNSVQLLSSKAINMKCDDAVQFPAVI